MDLGRTIAGTLGVLLMTCAALSFGADTADPWKGKQRAEVVAWLGEPDKARKKGGAETLTYRVVRLEGDAAPAADLRVIELPEVGRVGRRLPHPAIDTDTLSIEPTEITRRGETTAGGVTSSRSRTVSRELGEKRGATPATDDPRPIPAGTKLKLKFVLDAAGIVVDWSVSGGGKRY